MESLRKEVLNAIAASRDEHAGQIRAMRVDLKADFKERLDAIAEDVREAKADGKETKTEVKLTNGRVNRLENVFGLADSRLKVVEKEQDRTDRRLQVVEKEVDRRPTMPTGRVLAESVEPAPVSSKRWIAAGLAIGAGVAEAVRRLWSH